MMWVRFPLDALTYHACPDTAYGEVAQVVERPVEARKADGATPSFSTSSWAVQRQCSLINGKVAQLEEYLANIQEVEGANPFFST